MKEKHLPQDFDAEQGVLGSVLYMPHLFSIVADSLRPDDFYFHSYRHPEIWQAMKTLSTQDIEIDILTVVEQLKHENITEINDAPVHRYLQHLWDDALYNGPNIEQYADFVLNAAIKRRIFKAVQDMAAIVATEEDAQIALEKAGALLANINEGIESSDLRPLSEVMQRFIGDLDARQRERGKLVGIPTGFDDLDILLGGLQKQELLVLGGRPGEGKTSLLLTIIYNLLTRFAYSIAFFSLEMGEVDLARRLVSMDTHIDSQNLRTRWLEDDQWDKVVDSVSNALANNQVFIDESGDLSIASMRTRLQRHKAKHGLDLIVVDYLQLMQSEDEGKRPEPEVVQLSKISRGLKKLAKHFDVPLLALASLNRASESRADKRPVLSDLRGSGSIEFDADVVMFISRARERTGYSIINVEKHRNGPIGDVTLRFDPKLTRFYNDDTETEEGSR